MGIWLIPKIALIICMYIGALLFGLKMGGLIMKIAKERKKDE